MSTKIRWAWLTGDEETAHLCVIVEPSKRVVALCNHPFLTTVQAAADTLPKCEECLNIWKSGNEISITDDSGAVVVVRNKVKPYTGGSLDPFVDMADALNQLGVAYILVVAIPGQSNLRFWSNFVNFGANGIAAMKNQVPEIVKKIEDRFESLQDGSA